MNVQLQVCECFYSCGDDPRTACSLSGDWHQHAAYPCPIHPEAETS